MQRRLCSALHRILFALLICATFGCSAALHAQSSVDGSSTGLVEHSSSFAPPPDEIAQQRLAAFRTLKMTQEAVHAPGDETTSTLDPDPILQLQASLNLFRSLGSFDALRSRETQRFVDEALLNSDPNSHLFAEASLLSALEYFSHTPLRHEDVEAGVARLTKLNDSAALPLRIRAEVYFWLAEGDRALDLSENASVNYHRAEGCTEDTQLLGLIFFRLGELEEAEQQNTLAEGDFHRARETDGSALQLLASLRRAAVLRTLADYAGVLQELRITDSLSRTNGKTAQFSAREFHYVSPLILSMELHPAETERLLADQENAVDSLLYDGHQDSSTLHSNLATLQIASPFVESEIDLLRGSALSELNRYDTASIVLHNGLTSLADVRDTVGSYFIARLRDFLRDALEFEHAWSLFRQSQYDTAAQEFLSLAAADTVAHRLLTHSVNLTLREQGRFADPFYEDPNTIVVATLDPSILDQKLIDTTFFIYNDFPERSRFYAGVALARSGKYAQAEQVFVSLVQDKSVIYSSRARYQLGLIRFIRKNYVEAASIFEPLSIEASTSGAFSAFLMGEICYRKSEYESAERYFKVALNAIPDTLYRLRATAFLERGLSLIALGSWKSAARDLRRYLQLSPNSLLSPADTARKVEALFWLGKSYLRSRSLDSARTQFLTILQAFPENPRAIDAEYNYAWCLFREDDFRDAESAFEKVIAMDSVTRYSYDALARAGDCYYALQDYDDAISIYNWAVDRPAFNDYRTTHALFQLGITRMREDSGRSAMNVFRTLIRKFPTSPLLDRAYFNRALAAYSIKQNDEAEADVDKLVKNYPQSEFASRGMLFAADRAADRGADPTAIRYYQRILDRYAATPEVQASLFGLQDVLVREKKSVEAIAAAESFIAQNPTSPLIPAVLLRKGIIEFEASKWTASRQTMHEFIDQYPTRAEIPEARYYLGRSDEALKDTVSALAAYHEIISTVPDDAWSAASWLEIARINRNAGQRQDASAAYVNAFDMRYYSMDAAPEALAEYAEYLVERTMKDSAISTLQTLSDRYGLQTGAGARAELRIAELEDGLGRHRLAQNSLLAVASVRHDMLGGLSEVRLGEMELRAGAWQAAMSDFTKAKSEYALSDESEMRRLFGVAEASTSLKRKSAAIAALRTLLADYNLSAREKARALEMMNLVNPKKSKPAKHTKKGSRR